MDVGVKYRMLTNTSHLEDNSSNVTHSSARKTDEGKERKKG